MTGNVGVLPDIWSLLPDMFLALHHDNGTRKGFNNSPTVTRGLNSTDSKMLEYKEKYEEFTKLKKILDLVKCKYENRYIGSGEMHVFVGIIECGKLISRC